MAVESPPFIGPRPYTREQRDRFFGRARETSELASLVLAHPIVFLYGQSGAGKTSLIQAGLLPALADEEGFELLPVARPGGRAEAMTAEPERSTANPYVRATLLAWADDTAESASPAEPTLAAFLAERPSRVDAEGMPAPRLLVFDQLEELFTRRIDRGPEREAFFAQIGGLVVGSRERAAGRPDAPATPPLRVLLAMREEYIAELDALAPLLPDKLRIRFRLERLRPAAALEAVTGPLRGTRYRFAPGVAERLVDDLREIRIETGEGERRRASRALGPFVEPVQLQVVGAGLLQSLPPGVSVITREHLSAFGNVDVTLRTFYDDAVAAAAAAARLDRDEVGRWCETTLITSTGTRAIVHQGPTHSEGIPNAAPETLVEKFLLRREERAGAFWYELAHDRLIGPIQASRIDRERLDAERRGEQTARLRREGERRRRRLLVAATLVLSLLGAAVAVGGMLSLSPPDCEGTFDCTWTFRTGAEVFGRPAVANDLVYVPSVDGTLYAVDPSAREWRWQLPVFRTEDGEWRGRRPLDLSRRATRWVFPTGGQVWTSPAVAEADTVLLFGSEDGNLYALYAATGKPRWAAPFTTGGPVVSSPEVVDGVVYVGGGDGKVYALDATTGKQAWPAPFATGGPVFSSPAVVDGVVYIGSEDGNLYAVDAATGKPHWDAPFKTEGAVRSSPAVANGVVYVGSYDGSLYAVDAASGVERWQVGPGARVRSSPTVVDGVVYVGSFDCNLYALDAETGEPRWGAPFTTGARIVSSPTVAGGVVYVGSDDGDLYAVDAASGTERGRVATEGGSVVRSFPTVSGREVIFGDGAGMVYAFDHTSSSGVASLPSGTPEAILPGEPPSTPPGSATAAPAADRGGCDDASEALG